MHHWLSLDTVIELMLGISLSAACGFRVFVPLLVMSVAAVLGHVPLPADFDWVNSSQALWLFAIASVVEVGGYYVPWVDHMLEIVALPLAIAAGTLVTAAVAPEQLNPLVQWTLALVVGGGAAGLTRGMNWFVRIISTALSAGLTNPIFATIELAIALGLAVLALTVPVFAGVLVLSVWLLAANKIRRFLAQRQQSAQPPTA
ncbi:DUF4126 domain-containing protein [Leptolyngbya sp. AN02str]|uniref:DUF4126 domain-containing protein n=1 Tax=Leptolyngbya sp. AN02str TaxID=3423363 RepID=UPI003D319E60